MNNKQRLQALFQEYANKNIQGVLAAMSDDVVWTTEGPADIIPYAGVHKGKAGVAKMFETQATVLEDAKFLAQPQLIGGDDDPTQVFYMEAETVKLKAPPHNEYKTGFAMFFTFNDDGMITKVASLFDTYAVAKAFEP